MNLHFLGRFFMQPWKLSCFPNATKFALNTISGATRIVKYYFKKNVTGLLVLYGIYLAGFENKKTVIYLTMAWWKPKLQFLSFQKA